MEPEPTLNVIQSMLICTVIGLACYAVLFKLFGVF